MKTSFSHIILILSCVIFLQCHTSKIVHEQTDNEFEKLIKKLQKDPFDEKTIILLAKKYAGLRQSHLGRIETFEKDQSLSNTESTFKEFAALQQYFSSIQAVPGLNGKVKPIDYTAQIQALKMKLVADLQTVADHFLKQGDKASCRLAYYNFLKLQDYRDDLALEDKIKQSLQCGSLHIFIQEPQMDVRNSRYNSEIEYFYRGLVSSLKTNSATPFISIVSSNDEIDESIGIYFNQFTIGSTTKDNNSRDVVNTQTPAGGRRSSASSSTYSAATITTTRVEYLSVAELQVQILDKDGNFKEQQQFNARHEWNNEVNSFTGDRRALTSADRAQLRNPVKTPPTDTEIANDLIKQLTERVVTYLQNRWAGL